MKRDMDLVRKILFAVENSPEEGIENFTIEPFSREQIIYHIRLLQDAELIEGTLVGSDNAGILRYGIDRMTWAGHEFLDACRNEGRWIKAKEIFSNLDGVTFDVSKQVLVSLMTTAASSMITGGAP
ncbi:MAG: DUF2513 domain-containing protein [Methanomicrobiales archaeon]